MMNPLAQKLNDEIKQSSPEVLDMMSQLGKDMFYPKGILSQSAEAKRTTYNATIGMATKKDGKMYANSLNQMFNDLTPDEIFPYAPPQGVEELRDLWQKKMLKENPDLKSKSISRPIVTNALTHGLSLVADLFVDTDDTVLLPTHNWGNYKLVFSTRHGAHINTYPIFDDSGHFTTSELVKTLKEYKKDKVIIILNYPNNPTGYTPNKEEVNTIVNAIEELANKGTKVVTVVDDAYYGLFYEEVYQQSIFTALTQVKSSNLLPVRLDGATKEFFSWGFRVGFMTFGIDHETLKNALEAKVKGLIRSNISSSPLPSQSAIKHVLKYHEQFDKEIDQNINILKERYEVTKQVVYDNKYAKYWQAYDFNSGYFMSLKLNQVDPEELRKHLINNYSIGIIALNSTDIRIAFSCVEKEDIPYVFESIANAIDDIK